MHDICSARPLSILLVTISILDFWNDTHDPDEFHVAKN